jgi:hypothetical protein
MRLNIDLLADVAITKPDWQIILVGPQDDAFKNSTYMIYGMFIS